MIEICVHAYAETLPQFAVFLQAQLSSLVLFRPKVETRISVCYCEEDQRVFDVLESFQDRLRGVLKTIRMEKSKLFRRSIGRDHVSKSTRADLVWHTDADHYFGEGCLDSLYNNWKLLNSPNILFWPNKILMHKAHSIGDEFCKKNSVLTDRLLEIDPTEFSGRRYGRAIGGVQIVCGKFSRLHGYKVGRKYLKPVSPDRPFPNFRDDVHFRHFALANGGGCGVDIENLYRMRHSKVSYR